MSKTISSSVLLFLLPEMIGFLTARVCLGISLLIISASYFLRFSFVYNLIPFLSNLCLVYDICHWWKASASLGHCPSLSAISLCVLSINIENASVSLTFGFPSSSIPYESLISLGALGSIAILPKISTSANVTVLVYSLYSWCPGVPSSSVIPSTVLYSSFNLLLYSTISNVLLLPDRNDLIRFVSSSFPFVVLNW